VDDAPVYVITRKIEEVRVSNIARSQDEIKVVMADLESYFGVTPLGKLANTYVVDFLIPYRVEVVPDYRFCRSGTDATLYEFVK